jgi:dodecin
MESEDGGKPPNEEASQRPYQPGGKMAKTKSKKSRAGESVYRITELVGTSTVSWEDAAKRAVETAAGSLRDLRVADIVKLDVKVDGGKVVAYRARVSLSFKYEA